MRDGLCPLNLLAAYEALAARASRDGRWRALNMALGENEGVAEINVSVGSDFSSFLPQLPAAANLDSQARVIRTKSIRVARLDHVFAELPQRAAAFLKIDTQGYERRQVLLGASECLSDFVGVQVELQLSIFISGLWRFPRGSCLYEPGWLQDQ